MMDLRDFAFPAGYWTVLKKNGTLQEVLTRPIKKGEPGPVGVFLFSDEVAAEEIATLAGNGFQAFKFTDNDAAALFYLGLRGNNGITHVIIDPGKFQGYYRIEAVIARIAQGES